MNTLDSIEAILQILSFSIHIFYFACILEIAQMRKRSLIFLHSYILVGFLINTHYLIGFLFNSNKTNSHLNQILNNINETVWIMLQTFRAYSIGLTIWFQLIKIKFPVLYRRINKSLFVMVTFILIAYIWSMNIVLVGKYLFEGRCFDCYTVEKRFSYLVFQGFFGILVPNLFSLFSNIFIRKKLIELINFKIKDLFTKNYCNIKKLRNRSSIVRLDREKVIAKRILIKNLCELVNCVGVIVYLNMQAKNEFFKFTIRISNIILQASIPFITIAYSPLLIMQIKKRLLKKIFYVVSKLSKQK